MRLKGKTAIVTGGGSGIGQEICNEFSRQGARVAVADISLSKARDVANKINEENPGSAIPVEVDITDEKSAERMAESVYEHFKGIDILVNNAGARCVAGFLEHSLDDWDKMIKINLTGPFLCSQAVVPTMKKKGKGKIVNLASIASFMGRPDRVAYVAAKTGVLGLTRAMAVDLASDNINVNAVAPGMIATPFNAMYAEDPKTGPEWAKESYLGRWGRPEDIAMAVLFLASDESDYMTGAEVKVDGGWLAAKHRKGEIPD